MVSIISGPYRYGINKRFLLKGRSAHLSMFRSQVAIVSENPLFSLFPIEYVKFQNLTLP